MNQESRIMEIKYKIKGIIHDSLFMIRKNGGFTLVELLASIIVLVAVGSIISGIISSTLRGTNKASNIENIRQNGNYVLNQMSKDIAYSQPLDGNTTGFNLDSETGKYLTSCPRPPSSPTLTDITVRSAGNANNVTKYVCGSVLTANEMPLIDDSVSLQSCSLTCTQTNAVPLIGITFTLAPKTTGLAESGNEIEFKTSVTLRNYGK